MPKKPPAPVNPLAALTAKAGKSEPSASAKEEKDTILLDRPEDAELLAAAGTLLAALHAQKAVEGHKAAALAVVLPELRRRVLARWAARGQKGPSTRVLAGGAGSFTFTCRDATGRFQLKADAEGNRPTMEEHLIAAGVPQDLVERLRDRAEWTEETVLSIDLESVRQERPDVFERLTGLLQAANLRGGLVGADGRRHFLSDADLGVLLQSRERVAIADGFLGRAPAHARETAPPGIAGETEARERLEALLTAIPPTWSIDAPLCADADRAVGELLSSKRTPGTEGTLGPAGLSLVSVGSFSSF